MRRSAIHIVLFLLTVASTWLTWGPSYSVPVMLILLGHEMGHYLVSRRYGIRATLPYFLPLPFISPFGTLGAVIRMEGAVSSRKALFDTGVAGPLTGFCLSIPAVAIGLSLSTKVPSILVREAGIRLADPLLFSLLLPLVLGRVPEHFEVLLHPIGYAGWVGLFVTGLNLSARWSVGRRPHHVCAFRKEEPVYLRDRDCSDRVFFHLLQHCMGSAARPHDHIRPAPPLAPGSLNPAGWDEEIDRRPCARGPCPLLYPCALPPGAFPSRSD